MAWSWRELRWLNNVLGWWPDACQNERWRKIHDIRGRYFFWMLFLLALPELAHLYFVTVAEEFKMYDFIVVMVPVLMAIQYFSKTFIFILKRERIKEAVESINEMDLRVKAVIDPEVYTKLSKPHLFRCELGLLYFAVYIAVGVQWMVSPFIYAAYGMVVFSLESTYPWDEKTTVGWWLTYCLQFVHVSSVIYSYCLIDIVLFGMFIQTHFLMDCLKHALKNVNFDPKGKEPTINFCIKLHQDILHLCENINFIVGLPLMISVTFSTIVMCLCIFLFSSTGGHNLKSLNLLQVAGSQVLEMFFFNWLCQNLEDQEEKIMRAAYFSDWYNRPIREVRGLIVLSEMSKRKITFGLLVTSNFQTFVTVLQTTFSYYNFMIAVSE